MRIILVGTNHAHQFVNHKDGDHENFANYLKKVYQEENVELIAEELSEEAILKWCAADSTARKLANENGIQHLFCDPNKKERVALGILDYEQLKIKNGWNNVTPEQHTFLLNEEKKYWPARENYWLEKILSANFQNCLFIIGASHVTQFSNLISSKGHVCEVIIERWNP